MHEWIAGLPMWDLVVALDDADGRILHARFVQQEGVASTFEVLEAVLRRYGRFCELYTDRGSHFCRTAKAGEPPAEEQFGQVARALHVLGINHIRARPPRLAARVSSLDDPLGKSKAFEKFGSLDLEFHSGLSIGNFLSKEKEEKS